MRDIGGKSLLPPRRIVQPRQQGIDGLGKGHRFGREIGERHAKTAFAAGCLVNEFRGVMERLERAGDQPPRRDRQRGEQDDDRENDMIDHLVDEADMPVAFADILSDQFEVDDQKDSEHDTARGRHPGKACPQFVDDRAPLLHQSTGSSIR